MCWAAPSLCAAVTADPVQSLPHLQLKRSGVSPPPAPGRHRPLPVCDEPPALGTSCEWNRTGSVLCDWLISLGLVLEKPRQGPPMSQQVSERPSFLGVKRPRWGRTTLGLSVRLSVPAPFGLRFLRMRAEHLFMCSSAVYAHSRERRLCQGFARVHIRFLLVAPSEFVCILGIAPLSDARFAGTFSHSFLVFPFSPFPPTVQVAFSLAPIAPPMPRRS